METEALSLLESVFGPGASSAAAASSSGSHAPAADVARAYSTLWLAAIVRSCVALILSRVYAIPHLSPGASRQVQADLDYFDNVIAALGLTPDPLFKRTKELLIAPLEQYVPCCVVLTVTLGVCHGRGGHAGWYRPKAAVGVQAAFPQHPWAWRQRRTCG